MAQFCYDVVAQADGFVIMISPEVGSAFAGRQDAFDAAVDLARKLRFVGISLDICGDDRKERQRLTSRSIPPA